MENLKKYEEYVNEGFLTSLKKFLFPDIYRIAFDVMSDKRPDELVKKSKEKEERFHKKHPLEKMKRKTKRHFVDIKAQSEEEAEKKFWGRLEDKMHGMRYNPDVEIIYIEKTPKIRYKNLNL